MSPLPRLCPQCHHLLPKPSRLPLLKPHHARTASAITPAASLSQTTISPPPLTRYPPTQPPSHRPPEYRKSQLHRQYTSLLRSTPLLLLFQHNNLKSTEWMSIRRELTSALRKVDEQQQQQSPQSLTPTPPLAESIKIQIIQTSIFASALLVSDYFSPSSLPDPPTPSPSSPRTPSSLTLPNQSPSAEDHTYTHALSRAAHDRTYHRRSTHPLHPLLSGPLAVLSFPTVSPAHLSAALRILAPKAPAFPAPTRRQNPGYYELATQAGLQKLMLLGARVEGRVFDGEGVRWVGGIEGGMGGLRGRLVGMLGGVGAKVTGALEGVGRSLYVTVEGRRGMLEEEEGRSGE